ncbi:MAG TPA: mechanosensitive ion channel family protein [Gammaproteobacteria bacterium]
MYQIENPQLQAWLQMFSENPLYQAFLVVFIGLIIASLVNLVIRRIVFRLVHLTSGDLDNQIVHILRPALFYTILLISVGIALNILFDDSTRNLIHSMLQTIAILIWSVFLIRLSRAVLRSLSKNPNHLAVVNTQTLPLFENIAILLIVGGTVYFMFTAWNIDMTAWLASAGIVGIAVGFAAKDTLANLFSGVFIMADAPYKIGDYVVLDSGERGEVTHIGIRSTRILTRSDVEVTIPNSIMGNTKIINESGGPHKKYRIRIKVGVAYGSDIDKVKEILMDIALNDEGVCKDPEPRVRFRQFGGSSLDLELLCWIDEPMLRGRVSDSLNSTIYKRFNVEGVEIPYSKHDLYIKQMPGMKDD